MKSTLHLIRRPHDRSTAIPSHGNRWPFHIHSSSLRWQNINVGATFHGNKALSDPRFLEISVS